MNITSFDLNLLVVFDALLTDGSVTRAAKRVGLSQPAFSNALGRLRGALDDPLFERTGRGMVPTPRAVAMAAPVRAALNDLRRAMTVPLDLGAPSSIVSIAANQYAQYLVLPSAIRALMRRAPAVRLDVRDASASIAADGQEADLTLDWASAGPDRATPDRSASVVLRDSLVGVARRTNRAVGNTVSEAALARLNRICVQYGASSPQSETVGGEHIMSDGLSAMSVVSQTDAFAMVPHRLARRLGPSMGLKIFRPPHELVDIALQVAWKVETATDAAAIVRDCLVEAGARLAGGRRK